MHQTLLIIDRNQNVREFCREQLEHEGYNVVTAADGYIGLELAAALRPVAVVLDPFLRRMESYDVLRALRRLVPSARIVLFTVASDSTPREPWHATADAQVSKTQQFSDLVATLRRLLEADSCKEGHS